MSSYLLRVVLMSVAALWLAGCATIVGGGSSQVVTFDSAPKGAEVVIAGVAHGVTPTSISLKRKRDVVVTIQKEGFDSQTFQLQTKMNPWFWGNIITGGTFGSTTDAASGAITEYAPSSYYVTLQPSDASKDQQSRLLREMDIRNFVLVTYPHLAHDIAVGHGEYLTALSAKFVGIAEQAPTVTQLRTLLEGAEDVPAFADSLLRAFISRADAAPPLLAGLH